jgi:hypothetical protein
LRQFFFMIRKSLFAILLFTLVQTGNAQFLMDMIDTSKESGRGLLSLYQKFDHLRIGGYIQPQFQIAQSKGIKSFEGGDFNSNVSNRFMLRRSRIRIDYLHYDKKNQPGVQIVFQFDANERGFTMRDIWGRVFENKFHLFSFTMGMFPRPFGYEVNLSSSDRESPERGRMSQLLMRSERDMGAMISYDSRNKGMKSKLKFDIGVFNGQGINAAGEFDNTKDVISRLSLKPTKISDRVTVTAGASMLLGGLQNNTKYVFRTQTESGIKKVVVDSSVSNIGRVSPRRYYGADAQVKFKNRKGLVTEIRGEYIAGKQVGTTFNSETPTSLLQGNEGFHVRDFRGGYFYFLQNIFSEKHQLLLKYDWYDPNTTVKGNEIGVPGGDFTAANIKYSTLGLGYINYLTENAKLVLYYARVINENTQLSGFTSDIKDDVLTLRLQFRF